MMISLRQQHEFTRRILFREPSPAAPEDTSRYFGPPRFPGTTSIGYRQTHPEIFQDTVDARLESYDEWLQKSVNRAARSVIQAEEGCCKVANDIRHLQKSLSTLSTNTL